MTDYEMLDENDDRYGRVEMANRMRQEFPDGCELCGESADAEMGEFWDKGLERGIIAHAQCGIDAQMELA